jgi:putative FmdB family regulatory protein
MPIYEYEPHERDCLMCEGRVEVLQGVSEEALRYCPYCGLEVRRVISRASVQVRTAVDPESAAKKGFTTFRRAGKGVWEKVASPEQDGPKPQGDKAMDVSELEE